ncbi:MAG: GMC oxidoreductase [Steroidobacteraceae bacterium]
MPFISANAAQDGEFDVIVVGSGAAGGQSAYTMALEGVKVLMLEAGRRYAPDSETPMFQTPYMAPLRGEGTPDKPFGFYDATIDGGWQVPGEPYTSASDDPQRQFMWWRPRMLGGRTNHWGRIALRNGPYDFKPYSRDGLGRDWPLSYEQIAPYYDRVERLIGVYGSSEGMENTPDSSPGVLMAPPRPRVGELLAQKEARKLGVPFIPMHRAVMTERLDDRRLPALLHPGNPQAQRIVAAEMRKRAACFYATPCGRGCSIRATYQSTTVHLPPALASGHLHIACDAMVREVVVGKHGRASGVRFIDKSTGKEYQARARAVVLAAGACESVRILLNSGRASGDGLANSSGLVGRYIMDTVGSSLGGQVPRLESLPPHNEDGADGQHLYAPWWQYGKDNTARLGFARGYHIEYGSGRRQPNLGTVQGLEYLTGGSFGAAFKADMRRYYGSFVGFDGRGEMIPNDHCYCELDPTVKDRWGIPVLRFHWLWSEHETRQAAHMQQTFAAIIDAMGGRVTGAAEADGRKAIAPGGSIIHEVGGTIMGASPRDSVTNEFGQSWDIPNLVIADGATFCSNADKNPTLTIMALAWRNAEHLVERMKRREL